MSKAVHDPLFRAWAWLAGLSALGTALSVLAPVAPPAIMGLALLAIAFCKARIILLSYLGLDAAPSWRRGALASVAAAVLLFAGLYVAG